MSYDGLSKSGNSSYLSQNGLYGFTSDVNLDTFAYSGKIKITLNTPAANKAGTVYLGQVRLAQLMQMGVNYSYFTSDQLMSVADRIVHTDQFTLQSAIVNDYVLTHTIGQGGDKLTDYLKDEQLGSELVSFAVVQNYAVNITTGANAKYTISGEVFIDSVVMPRVTNLLYYRTYGAIFAGKQKKEIDFQYHGPPPPEVYPPVDYGGVKKLESAMSKQQTYQAVKDAAVNMAFNPVLFTSKSEVSDVEVIEFKARVISMHEAANRYSLRKIVNLMGTSAVYEQIDEMEAFTVDAATLMSAVSMGFEILKPVLNKAVKVASKRIKNAMTSDAFKGVTDQSSVEEVKEVIKEAKKKLLPKFKNMAKQAAVKTLAELQNLTKEELQGIVNSAKGVWTSGTYKRAKDLLASKN